VPVTGLETHLWGFWLVCSDGGGGGFVYKPCPRACVARYGKGHIKVHVLHLKGKYRNILRGCQGFAGVFDVFCGNRAVFRLK
jgi:hypothetical protein